MRPVSTVLLTSTAPLTLVAILLAFWTLQSNSIAFDPMSPDDEAAWLGGQTCPSSWVLRNDTDVVLGANPACASSGSGPSGTACPSGVGPGGVCSGAAWCPGGMINRTCSAPQFGCGWKCVDLGSFSCPRSQSVCDGQGFCTVEGTGVSDQCGTWTDACE